ncbi:putative zinc ribbon protein [Citrobacter meridianamericanus]|uniref:putative zinc ribbon protein n=1 Tax=Citrobacter meridianamericanus TaxID=2894201 RepID=UPI00351D451F
MIKSYPGISDPLDYARFCDINSFDPDSPFIRKYYKKSVAELAGHQQRSELRRSACRPAPVFAIGLTSAIELAVSHLTDNTGYSRPVKYRCVACNIEFSGQRICPRCGNHVYCVGVDYES